MGADVLRMGGESSMSMGEVEMERNCVRSISLILYELLTDTVPFAHTNASEVAQLVCDGGVPDISLLHSIDHRLSSILSSALLNTTLPLSLTLNELHFQLNAYYCESALYAPPQMFRLEEVDKDGAEKREDNSNYSAREDTVGITH